MTVIWSIEACSKHCPKSFRDEGGYQIVNIVNNTTGTAGGPTTPLATATTTPTPGGIAAALTPTRTTSTPTTTVGGTATTGGDLDMASRHDLQGASCTVGGVLRGRAHGNVYNMADNFETEDPFIKPVIGVFFWFRIVDCLFTQFQVKSTFSGYMATQMPWSLTQ